MEFLSMSWLNKPYNTHIYNYVLCGTRQIVCALFWFVRNLALEMASWVARIAARVRSASL